jgi:hypothetical protein
MSMLDDVRVFWRKWCASRESLELELICAQADVLRLRAAVRAYVDATKQARQETRELGFELSQANDTIAALVRERRATKGVA